MRLYGYISDALDASEPLEYGRNWFPVIRGGEPDDPECVDCGSPDVDGDPDGDGLCDACRDEYARMQWNRDHGFPEDGSHR